MRRRSALRHPIFARFYERLSRAMEDRGTAEHRRELLDGLAGRVIEIGAGNGMNFAHYPEAVTEVLAVEPEPYLRQAAERNAAAAPIPVTVVAGTANALPAEDASFDAAVFSLVLCSVADQRAALDEAGRVLRPEGELRFFEHVQAQRRGQVRIQNAADVLWPRLFGGCHTSRDTVSAIDGAGFEVTALRRFMFPEARVFVPAAPHVIGAARAPGPGRGGPRN